jgi:hypothetical protein
MKNLSFIILGTIAVVLIGLAMQQLMWMSDVVDNYDATKSYNIPDLKNNMKDNGNNDIITGQPFEEETGSILDSPRINLDKEDQSTVVRDRPSTLDSKEVKSVSVKELPVITDSPDSKNGDRKIISSSNNEKLTIGEDDSTVSINLKGDKPLPPRRQIITETPISPGKPLNIPARSVTQHATSTSPY